MAKSLGGEKYMSVSDAAKLGQKEQFFGAVREEIIPRLIKSGKLKGKKNGKDQQVLIDAAFERLMHCGIEQIVYNTQGWSFSAADAPFDDVAKAMQSLPEVAKHRANVAVGDMKDCGDLHPSDKVRNVILVQAKHSKWPVIVQTVHWFMDVDAMLATLLAARLSAALKTQAVAAWDDDFAGSTAIVCKDGGKIAVVDDSDGSTDFYQFFYEHEIGLPACFIAGGKKGSDFRLFANNPDAFERADHFVLNIPKESRSKGPHVFEKFGAMAEAIELGLEDESAFRSHAVEQLWQRVRAIIDEPPKKSRGKGR